MNMKISKRIYCYSRVDWNDLNLLPTIHIWNGSLYDVSITFAFLAFQFCISIERNHGQEI